MWYGKGPGVDRCGDVFKHGNAAGTSKFGGVLALAADDHNCRSSTLPHGGAGIRQRDDADPESGRRAGHPRHGPARLGDVALYRTLGRLQDHRRNGGVLGLGGCQPVRQLDRAAGRLRNARGGLNIRWPDPPLDQEMRLHRYAVDAAQAFARANKIDRIVLDAPKARLGIVTTGKSYLDVLQALEYLGHGRARLRGRSASACTRSA
jgi:indolepyruvate ferredoxin oxidoreductase